MMEKEEKRLPEANLKEIDCYRIQVRGVLDSHWSDWFHGLEISCTGGLTTMTGSIIDQARLRGILTKLWDLNLELVNVTLLGKENELGGQL